MEDCESGEASEEFGDHAVFDEIFGLEVFGLEFWEVRIFGESDEVSVGTETFLHDRFQVGESAGGDEEDAAGVDGRYGSSVDGVAQTSFEESQQSVLNTFTADVAAAGVFAADLIDFIEEDDSFFCKLYVAVCLVEQCFDDIIDGTSSIAGLDEASGASVADGNAQVVCKKLDHVGLPRTGWSDEK